MDITQMETVIAIVVITYLLGLGCKASKNISDDWIPVIVGIAGGILGAFGMKVMPNFPAKDIINAIAVGIISGLASTGVNQAYKQLKGK